MDQGKLETILRNYLKSDDFKIGVIAATRASWGGSGYTVEIFPNGTWRNVWNNSIGNLYESEGILLRLPTLDDNNYQEMVNGVDPMGEDDYFNLCFAQEKKALKQELLSTFKEKNNATL